jgi:hypothetical protein
MEGAKISDMLLINADGTVEFKSLDLEIGTLVDLPSYPSYPEAVKSIFSPQGKYALVADA